jgi:hypothetical protein
MAAGSSSQRPVESDTFVKKKVTVPAGNWRRTLAP